MCGIVGIVANSPVNQTIYDALTVLQHRGQDAGGIMTIDDQNRFRLRKANGLVKDVFSNLHMHRLQGSIGIGHVRYPTAGSSSSAEAQPFYSNSPFGVALAHNGNLTNAEEAKQMIYQTARRHVNTTSDSEVLLNVLAHELSACPQWELKPEDVFNAVSATICQVRGGYAAVSLIIGHGLVAFRDPNGIRPLVLGSRIDEQGNKDYMVSSESVALDVSGFKVERDIAPGEAVYITQDGQLFSKQCSEASRLNPCIFEFVYFARPDSFIDNISVYQSRVRMGRLLGQKVGRELNKEDIDVIIPIPETSCDIALEMAAELKIPYRQGFVKNRYIGRTFIMPGQQARQKSVRRKLNAIGAEFKGKNVLLVDDSIVRGTTSQQIIEMARESGANKVYFASAAPEIRYPNVYGIDMPSAHELIAHGRELDEICQELGADGLVYQDLSDLIQAVQEGNPEIAGFETSVFDGKYITQDIDESYLARLNNMRNDDAKADKAAELASNLEMHNEGHP